MSEAYLLAPNDQTFYGKQFLTPGDTPASIGTYSKVLTYFSGSSPDTAHKWRNNTVYWSVKNGICYVKIKASTGDFGTGKSPATPSSLFLGDLTADPTNGYISSTDPDNPLPLCSNSTGECNSIIWCKCNNALIGINLNITSGLGTDNLSSRFTLTAPTGTTFSNAGDLNNVYEWLFEYPVAT